MADQRSTLGNTPPDDGLDEEAFQELAANFRGQLIRSRDDGYDGARAVFNGMIDRRPALIARCAGVADVIAAVNFARENDLQVAVRGGGHSVPGYAVVDRGVVVDLSPMKGVWLDPEARVARAQAGLTWGELDRETQAFGLAVTGGRVSNTGIAGLTLGGGSGWLERKIGFTVDNLISADVVTADGRFVRASEERNKDLFWGLKGGGGNFGIVTSFEYRLHPVGPIILGGMLMYPAAQAPEVLRFYRDFIAEAPDEVSGGCAFVTAPHEPFVPEPVQGSQVLTVIVCYVGSLEEGEAAIRPLREFGPPALDMVQPMPYTALQTMIDAGSPPGMQNYWKAGFLDEFPDEAIDAFVDQAQKVTSPLTNVLLFPMGGALARVADDETPLSLRDAAYNFHAISVWADPIDPEKHISWAREIAEAMEPWTSERIYLNFIGDEGEERVQTAYDPEKYQRLVTLKDKYDPTNMFHLNQNIRPTAGSGAASS
jgi:FAD/FMN-containing dehydrogenase